MVLLHSSFFLLIRRNKGAFSDSPNLRNQATVGESHDIQRRQNWSSKGDLLASDFIERRQGLWEETDCRTGRLEV